MEREQSLKFMHDLLRALIARTRVADCSGVRARSLWGRISPSSLMAGGKPAVTNKSEAFFSVTRRSKSCISLMA